MRKFLFLGFVIVGGCGINTPQQIGHKKYTMQYLGARLGQSAAIERVQGFCRDRGFAYAEVVDMEPPEMTFFCMNEGDRLVSRSAPKVCVGVENCN